MYKYLAKNGQLLAFLLGIIIVVLFLGSILTGLDGFNALGDDDKGSTGIFNLGLSGAIALTILGAVAAILFSIYQVATNPKGSLKGLLGIVALILVFFIGKTMAAPDMGSVLETVKEFNVTENQSALISAGLITCLSLVALAGAAFVFSEIRNFFK